VVAPRAGAVDQPYFDVIGGTHTRRRHLGAAEPAQRHDGIHAVRRRPGGIDAAKQPTGRPFKMCSMCLISQYTALDAEQTVMLPATYAGLAAGGCRRSWPLAVSYSRAGWTSPSLAHPPVGLLARAGRGGGREEPAGDLVDRHRAAIVSVTSGSSRLALLAQRFTAASCLTRV
jgi:hypothetical protein